VKYFDSAKVGYFGQLAKCQTTDNSKKTTGKEVHENIPNNIYPCNHLPDACFCQLFLSPMVFH
jgi:hypothetical protein